MDTFRVANLEGGEQGDCLNGVIASVNKISHKEIVCEGDISSDSEEFDEIMQLTMNIAADCHRGFDWGGVGLFLEDGFGLISDEFNLFFGDGLEVSQIIDDQIDFCLIHQAII